MKKVAITILMLSVAACASIGKEKEWSDQSDSTAELLVYREPGSHSVELDAYFGSAKSFVVALGERQYASFMLPAGEQAFRAEGQGSVSSSLRLHLENNTKTCIKLKANAAQWVMAVVPIVGSAVPAFTIEQVECPNDSFFAYYKRVSANL